MTISQTADQFPPYPHLKPDYRHILGRLYSVLDNLLVINALTPSSATVAYIFDRCLSSYRKTWSQWLSMTSENAVSEVALRESRHLVGIQQQNGRDGEVFEIDESYPRYFVSSLIIARAPD